MAPTTSPATPKQLLAEISAGKFKPVYYFFGSEDYRIVEAEKFIAGQFLPNRQRTTNYRKIDGRRTKLADLLAELSVYPMIGEKQLIAVSDIQGYKPTDIDRILQLLDPPDPNRLVVLSSPSARTPRKTSALLNKLAKTTMVVEFKKLTARDVAGMIKGQLARHEMTIEPEALTMLTDLVAGNRGALVAETDKLANFKKSGEKVTVDDVRAVAAGYQVYSVFDLSELIVAGEGRRVLKQVRALLAEGNSPTGILFFVGQHFLSLYLVKNGKPLDAKRRWLAGRFREQARRFENQLLESCLVEIAQTDAALRWSGLKPDVALEALVVKLIELAANSEGKRN